MSVGKIVFNIEDRQTLTLHSKVVDLYLAVWEFDGELRDLEKYQDIQLIDIDDVRAMLRKHLQNRDCSLDMLS